MEKIKHGADVTFKTGHIIYDILSLAAYTAAAIKLTTLELVIVRGEGLPIWQIIAGFLFITVAYELYCLKKGV